MMEPVPFRDCPYCGHPIKVCRNCGVTPVRGKGRMYCPDCAKQIDAHRHRVASTKLNQTPYRKMYKKLHAKYQKGLLTRAEFEVLRDTYKLTMGTGAKAS